MSEIKNPMMEPRITKVTVNIGVGEGGERLQTAEQVLHLLTGLKPIRTIGRIQNRDLKMRKGAPVGCKVTLRNSEKIGNFLKDAFWVRENNVAAWNFDNQGNLSFGLRDYTDFPDQKYDPDIGIFGMDINVVLERPGHRVSRRRRRKGKISGNHRITREESKKFFVDKFGINIMEE